jgi:cytochrome o ubiquinol oxidase subunit II
VSERVDPSDGAVPEWSTQAGMEVCEIALLLTNLRGKRAIAMQTTNARGCIVCALRAVRACLLIYAPVLLTGCGWAVLEPAGPVSDQQRTILLDALTIMLSIVIPVIVATIWVAWWYRQSNARAHRMPDFTFSGRIEIVTWSIPALVVIFLGGIAWIGSHDLDPAKPLSARAPPLEVQVISLDWKWLFIYPQQGIASVNRLVVPTGVPLRLRLTSDTVWNVFWVPRLGSMLYCMNGMAGTLWLQADRPGVYNGASAMISGDGFATMRFDTDAVVPAQFATWVRSVRVAGPVLDASSYRELQRPTMSVAASTYRAVQPGLFEAIVLQRIPPGDRSPVSQSSQSASIPVPRARKEM